MHVQVSKQINSCFLNSNKYYEPTFIYIMQEILKVANISQCDAVY